MLVCIYVAVKGNLLVNIYLIIFLRGKFFLQTLSNKVFKIFREKILYFERRCEVDEKKARWEKMKEIRMMKEIREKGWKRKWRGEKKVKKVLGRVEKGKDENK